MALRRAHLLVPLFLFLAASSAAAGSLEGTVVKVVDGDTIYVQLGDRVEKIRYIGVNSPEIHHPIKGEEPGGREAAEVNPTEVSGSRWALGHLDVAHHSLVAVPATVRESVPETDRVSFVALDEG